MRTLIALGAFLVGQAAIAAPVTAKPSAAKAAKTDPASIAAEVDKHIEKALSENKIPLSPQADDAQFIRRATLDITGTVPSAERVLAFIKETAPDKRARLIDELLADEEYGEHFAIIWYHRIVKLDDDNRRLIAKNNLQDWLEGQFNKNLGWDRVVSNMLLASGERDKNPETVFYLAHVDDNKRHYEPAPNKLTAATGRLFMGVRLECSECHNNPFCAQKQTDFWGVAAFFTSTHAENSSRKDVKSGDVPSIYEGAPPKIKKADPTPAAPAGSIVIPESKGKIVKAKFLEGPEPSLAGNASLRQTLVSWLTSPKNRFFAPALVNKMWANFFGRGIVNPVDSVDIGESTHPEVLKLLADEFAKSSYDLKHLIRCICATKAYQRSSDVLSGNKNDNKLYSHMPTKVLSADMLFDSLEVVLGHAVTEDGKGGKKKKGSAKGREEFRRFFHAEADDDVGVVEDYLHGVPQVLHLMNARPLNDTGNIISKLMKNAKTPDAMIEALYLRVLSRLPTQTEIDRMKKYVAGEKDTARAYGDLMWTLVNTGEFIFNH